MPHWARNGLNTSMDFPNNFQRHSTLGPSLEIVMSGWHYDVHFLSIGPLLVYRPSALKIVMSCITMFIFSALGLYLIIQAEKQTGETLC
jgi:hypothetical protein